MENNNLFKKGISKEFIIDFIANSISFETLVISKEDVINILDGKNEGYDAKSIKTVQNYYEGIQFSLSLLDSNSPMSENSIKDLHEIIVNGLSVGGLYRNVDISISGSNHTPPSYLKVYDRMKKYFITINDENNDLYYNIAFSHLQLMKIHPFLDGNGRLARIVLNFELVRNGLKPVIISFKEREEYFNLLEEFKVNKNINPFIDYLKEKQK